MPSGLHPFFYPGGSVVPLLTFLSLAGSASRRAEFCAGVRSAGGPPAWSLLGVSVFGARPLAARRSLGAGTVLSSQGAGRRGIVFAFGISSLIRFGV